MKGWRPEGWLHGGGLQDEVNGDYLDNLETAVFEKGADAILKALREELGVKPNRPPYKGCVVLIPDDP